MNILNFRPEPSASTEEAWDAPLQQGKFLIKKTSEHSMKGNFMLTAMQIEIS
jgi:hypothetical protein